MTQAAGEGIEIDGLLESLEEMEASLPLGRINHSEIEPAAPEIETHLYEIDLIAKKYPETIESPAMIEEDDQQQLSDAYHKLRGELYRRAIEYKAPLMSHLLYPDGIQGKLLKIIDEILNIKELRQTVIERQISEGEIDNPYSLAYKYSETVIGSFIANGLVYEEIFHTATDTIRLMDKKARENVKGPK